MKQHSICTSDVALSLSVCALLSLWLLPLLLLLLLLPLLHTGGHIHPVPGDLPPPHFPEDAHQWAQV
jgi:hypothetical protein